MDSLVPQVSKLLLPFILSQDKTRSTSTYPTFVFLLNWQNNSQGHKKNTKKGTCSKKQLGGVTL